VFVSRDIKLIKNKQKCAFLSEQINFALLHEISEDPEKEMWLSGIREELKLLRKKKVWTIIERTKDAKVLKTRWVLAKKIKTKQT
jgi:hypothetical protein